MFNIGDDETNYFQGNPCQRSYNAVPNPHRGPSLLVHLNLYQVLGPLSAEEVAQSTRLIKLLYSFMLDGKPGQQQREFVDWQPFAGKVAMTQSRII